MASFNVYNLDGKSVGTVERPELFNTPVDEKLIHRYFVWVRTMLRHTLAHTKTRGDVSGGGKKPWRQKGTGRARVGSSRSPIWRTGGIVFGPRKEQTWATRMPRTERRKAFFSSLASKAVAENGVIILDEWTMEAPRTKFITELLAKLSIEGKVLHIAPEYQDTIFKSTRNLPGITSKTIQATTVIDILNHDVLLLTKEGLKNLEEHFTPSV